MPHTGPLALDLRSISANPTIGGRLMVRFALSTAELARLELLDMAGRIVRTTDVGDFGPGEHEIDLAGTSRIPPGIYFARLSRAGRQATRRAVVLR